MQIEEAQKNDNGKYPAANNYFIGLYYLTNQPFCLHFSQLIDALRSNNSSHALVALKQLYKLYIKNYYQDVCYVYKFGAEKYGTNNHRKGMEWSRYLHAMARHFKREFILNEKLDDDSSLPHGAHILANILILAEYIGANIGVNDMIKI